MSFSGLGLLPELLRAVADKGYDVPSAIQVQAIPAVLAGRDVLAGAQTGTGKTAGFVLPILQRLVADTARSNNRAPRALVLTPTRELAAQVAQSARDYGKYVQIRITQVFGGVNINPQISALRSGCDVLVATHVARGIAAIARPQQEEPQVIGTARHSLPGEAALRGGAQPVVEDRQPGSGQRAGPAHGLQTGAGIGAHAAGRSHLERGPAGRICRPQSLGHAVRRRRAPGCR